MYRRMNLPGTVVGSAQHVDRLSGTELARTPSAHVLKERIQVGSFVASSLTDLILFGRCGEMSAPSRLERG